MALLTSLLLGFIPMFLFSAFVYWLDRYEKEPVILLGGVFIWGAVVASAGAFLINTLAGVSVYAFTGSEQAADFSTTSLSAPLVEESLKGLAVLLIFFLARREFDSVLDGIIYAAVTALGFAATENAFYIYNYGFLKNDWTGLFSVAFVRIVLVGWQHPFYTAFIGIGLALARMNRGWLVKIGAPLLGWFAAVLTHSFHNTMLNFFSGSQIFIGFSFDWLGWLGMFIFILVMINREKRWLLEYLQDEISAGVITSMQYKTACSTFQRFLAHLAAIGSNRFSKTSQFYQLCAELAHKKRELLNFGDETGNSSEVQRLRSDLSRLSPEIST